MSSSLLRAGVIGATLAVSGAALADEAACKPPVLAQYTNGAHQWQLPHENLQHCFDIARLYHQVFPMNDGATVLCTSTVDAGHSLTLTVRGDTMVADVPENGSNIVASKPEDPQCGGVAAVIGLYPHEDGSLHTTEHDSIQACFNAARDYYAAQGMKGFDAFCLVNFQPYSIIRGMFDLKPQGWDLRRLEYKLD